MEGEKGEKELGREEKGKTRELLVARLHAYSLDQTDLTRIIKSDPRFLQDDGELNETAQQVKADLYGFFTIDSENFSGLTENVEKLIADAIYSYIIGDYSECEDALEELSGNSLLPSGQQDNELGSSNNQYLYPYYQPPQKRQKRQKREKTSGHGAGNALDIPLSSYFSTNMNEESSMNTMPVEEASNSDLFIRYLKKIITAYHIDENDIFSSANDMGFNISAIQEGLKNAKPPPFHEGSVLPDDKNMVIMQVKQAVSDYYLGNHNEAKNTLFEIAVNISYGFNPLKQDTQNKENEIDQIAKFLNEICYLFGIKHSDILSSAENIEMDVLTIKPALKKAESTMLNKVIAVSIDEQDAMEIREQLCTQLINYLLESSTAGNDFIQFLHNTLSSLRSYPSSMETNIKLCGLWAKQLCTVIDLLYYDSLFVVPEINKIKETDPKLKAVIDDFESSFFEIHSERHYFPFEYKGNFIKTFLKAMQNLCAIRRSVKGEEVEIPAVAETESLASKLLNIMRKSIPERACIMNKVATEQALTLQQARIFIGQRFPKDTNYYMHHKFLALLNKLQKNVFSSFGLKPLPDDENQSGQIEFSNQNKRSYYAFFFTEMFFITGLKKLRLKREISSTPFTDSGDVPLFATKKARKKEPSDPSSEVNEEEGKIPTGST